MSNKPTNEFQITFCQACIFWFPKDGDQDFGDCRRYAPALGTPTTDSVYSCGDGIKRVSAREDS